VLNGTDLTGAQLVGANLTSAEIFYANLTSAQLVGADLTGAIWSSDKAVPEGWLRDNSGHLARAALGQA
jgi:hypothetical protein